jgi:hypothetical protein
VVGRREPGGPRRRILAVGRGSTWGDLGATPLDDRRSGTGHTDYRPGTELNNPQPAADARAIMRPLAAAVLSSLIALAALPGAALAAGECTPIDNRIKIGTRAAGDIVNQASIDVPKATVDGSTVSSSRESCAR